MTQQSCVVEVGAEPSRWITVQATIRDDNADDAACSPYVFQRTR